MVTQTIYTDAYMVVIDIGAVPPTAEWLEETTYLIDSAGHTTAIIAQTDQPTDGVTLQPVPFKPAQALLTNNVPSTTTPSAGPASATSPSATSTTAINPTVTSTTSTHKRNSSMTYTLLGVGVVLGVLIAAVTVYLLRRRRKRRSFGVFGQKVGSTDSSSSLNSLEKLVEGTRMTQGGFSRESDGEEMPSWEGFLKEVENIYERFDNTTILSSSVGSISRSDGSRPTVSELQEKYNELWRNKHSPPMDQITNFSNAALGAPTSNLPPLPKQTFREKSELTARKLPRPQSIGPVSILKRPARKGFIGAVHGILNHANNDAAHADEGSHPGQKQGPKVKKGVRFGDNEVREFGATPLPSRTNSMISRESGN